MTIAITGATGRLGRLVISSLLESGVPASDLVAAVRSPEKAADLQALGITVRQADYNNLQTLVEAFDGVDRLLLISSSEVGSRADQHRNAIDAASRAGVPWIAYTSILAADNSGMALAGEHKATEDLLAASGISHTLLRNGWYVENYTANLPTYFEYGTILGSAGEGRVSAATRQDLAAAAAAVLTSDGHEGAVYELGGDEAFTLSELATIVSESSGKTVTYTDLPTDQYAAALTQAGVPAPFAEVLADSDAGVARGRLYTDSGDLSRLIGRPTTSVRQAVAAAVA